MARKRAASPSHIDDFDDEFCENSCSSGKYFIVKLIEKPKKMKKMRNCFSALFQMCLGSKNQSNSLPVQRNAANARERARMRVLSSAFCRLKTKLPWVPADTKLSKLDTLRLATMYIQQLRSSLATGKDLYYTTSETSRFDANSVHGQCQTSLVSFFCTILKFNRDEKKTISLKS